MYRIFKVRFNGNAEAHVVEGVVVEYHSKNDAEFICNELQMIWSVARERGTPEAESISHYEVREV